jgi:hypothetical protein
VSDDNDGGALLLILLLFGGFIVVCVAAGSQSHATAELASQVEPIGENTLTFTIKAGGFDLSGIKSSYIPRYISNWAELCRSLGINKFRCDFGSTTAWNTNIYSYSSTWAQELDDILTLTSAEGFQIWFQCLGNPLGGFFGIDDANLLYYNSRTPALRDANGNIITDLVSAYEIANGYPATEQYLAKLAGDNSLSKNFFADSRIFAWSIGNECVIANKSGGVVTANVVYNWLVFVADYIRAQGGKVIADAWLVMPAGDAFVDVAPLAQDHADYIEYHHYGLWELRDYYTPNYNPNTVQYHNWDSWKTNTIQSYAETQLANALTYGGFTADKVIQGEFGIWRGHYTDQGVEATYSDQDVIDYYSHYFQAMNDAGIKNTSFYFINNAGDPSATYGMITPSGYGTATLRDGCTEIAAAYSGSPPPSTYNVSVSASSGGSVNPSVGTHTYSANSTVNFTATPQSGFYFSQWLKNGVNVGSSTSYSLFVSGDCTLQAVFTLTPVVTYTLTTSAVGAGTVNPATSVINQGLTVQVSALPTLGNHLDHWTVDSVDTDNINPKSVIMNADHTVTATFVADPDPVTNYTLTASSEVGGTITPIPNAYVLADSSSMTFTASALFGFAFTGFLIDGTTLSTTNPYNMVINGANRSIRAKFTRIVKTDLLTQILTQAKTHSIGDYCFEAGCVEPGVDNCNVPLRQILAQLKT